MNKLYFLISLFVIFFIQGCKNENPPNDDLEGEEDLNAIIDGWEISKHISGSFISYNRI